MSTTGQKIELNYARQLVKNYRDNKLGQKLLTDDTQAVWFSKEVILEALGLPASTDTKDITGLRFYFGAYERQAGYPANAADQDKLTLVITHTGLDNMQIDRGGVTETAYLDIIEELALPKLTQPSYPSPSKPSSDKHTFNEGQVCPPPPPSVSDLGLMKW